ncbi:MAG: IucA/IucC family protein [Aeromicrobium sp.]|uniref:IucA/IucC family protein n=1 Tax=Aeromicrobium sp. TaxID=1871063 RepID=UPI0026257E1E|nr:IucA/IucC family protein [Aeromicrobium sp.]MDF1706283.1 IucA/IucC family protein [Aeromicrobium sp.]
MPSSDTLSPTLDPAAAHLEPGAMELAHRHLVAKILAELTHERLFAPQAVAGHVDTWVVRTDDATTYRFRGRVHRLEHWTIDPASIERRAGAELVAVDALDAVVDLAPTLGIPDALLPVYLEEVASTLQSAAWKRRHHRLSSADLVHADLPTIEAAMTEGHPAFIANNGRIGFSLEDFAAYAPEAGATVRLQWTAVRRRLAHLSVGHGWDEASLWAHELDDDLVAGWRELLRGLGEDPDTYLFAPVHPWQWQHKLAVTFAPDVARRDIVPLGPGRDDHRAQQSIRTFLNASDPARHYVKTALSIQNMGFLRGLSPHYMRPTPAINDWVAGRVRTDPELQACGFDVLREVAAIGYTGGAYQRLPQSSPHQKMFAALWRESATSRLRDGERAATMASLLHRDAQGVSLVSQLVAASGLGAQEWLARYLRAYLRPLVHCLAAHRLAFMPHGENLILVLRDHAPVRVLMKDIGEEVAVFARPDDPEVTMPDDIARIRVDVEPDLQVLSILTDAVDGFLRFLAAICVDDDLIAQDQFWMLARAVLEEHAADHPEIADRLAELDVQRPRFAHSCLNRLQLRNTLQMVDLADQASSLIMAGELANPLAP